MYGSWLPAVSTLKKYGLRSSTSGSAGAGTIIFQALITGRSGLRNQNCIGPWKSPVAPPPLDHNSVHFVSLRSASFLSISAWTPYLGCHFFM